MKTFLSIDWDYFVDATTDERISLFPDGGNEYLSSYILDVVWATRYATSMLGAEKQAFSRKIVNMGVLDKEYRTMKKYLTNQVKSLSSIGVSESHALAYRMFSEQLKAGEQCNIINIDYHHDLYVNIPGTVDCGNWLSEMYREGKINKLYWVARTDSEDLPEVYQNKENIVRTTDLSGILSNIVTLNDIFICRSGVWSPPHLDDLFIKLIKAFCENYDSSRLPNRYTREFKTMIKQSFASQKQDVEKL